MSIKWLGIVVLLSGALTGNAVSEVVKNAEQLYTDQPPVTPELAFPGTYTVGVTTITATDPKRLNTANFILNTERQLVLEVWYPAALFKAEEQRKLAT